jgi:3-methyladenine DNA glycosylase/8-oxoguanine DNA glycosylase
VTAILNPAGATRAHELAGLESRRRASSSLLPYQKPFDWDTTLSSFRAHLLPELESVDDDSYERVTRMHGGMGWFRVTHAPEHSAVRLDVHKGNEEDCKRIARTVRRMFDLDAEPATITSAMQRNPELASIWRRFPGLRVRRSWSTLEALVTTVLGQLVSVSFGRTLTQELMQVAGRGTIHPKTGEAIVLFPTAEELLVTDLSNVRTSQARRNTIHAVAEGFVNREFATENISHKELRRRLLTIPGIGTWTAEYVAMHGFGDSDAFPATDYGLKQELKFHPLLNLNEVRPWRAYAAIALWKSFAARKESLNEPVL